MLSLCKISLWFCSPSAAAGWLQRQTLQTSQVMTRLLHSLQVRQDLTHQPHLALGMQICSCWYRFHETAQAPPRFQARLSRQC